MTLFSKAVVAATHNPIVRKLVTGTVPGRAVSERFVAGDTIDQGAVATKEMNRQGMPVSMDLLGEAVHDEKTAIAATEQYEAAIHRIASDSLDANVSVKLTQLGLDVDKTLAAENIDRLARSAAAAATSVTIDMEDSRYTSDTIDIYEHAQRSHGNLGLCLQACLRRTPDDLERVLPLGGHIRLCKGAYVEPESAAFTTKPDVDAAFARLLEPLMAATGVRPCVATHDDRLISLTRKLSAARVEPWEFQMLYGVRPNLAAALVSEDVAVRIYVPYGSEWYPYLTRRMAERPANTVFFLRALVGKN